MKSIIVFLVLLTCFLTGNAGIVESQSPTMLVSTLDGYLTAIDINTGREKWRYKEGPIIESQSKIRNDFSFIPNPRNGELYFVADKHLSKLPFTIPQLVKTSPCKSSDGILYAGSKKDVWIAMNPETGVHEETESPQTRNSCPIGNPETIFIGRTEYRISMLDTKLKDRTWDATFIDYSSHLLPVDQRYPFQHFHSVQDGRLVTIDVDTKQVIWKKDFRSVIVNMYLLKQDGMHQVPSTAVGDAVLEEVIQNIAQFVSPEWSEHFLDSVRDKTITQPQTLLQTLYIGESAEGLYALNSFVDRNTDVYFSRSLGPLLEGPKNTNFRSSNHNDNLHGPTFSSEDGEFLILGHHEVPPLLFKDLITTNSDQSRMPWIPYVQGNEKRKVRAGGAGSVANLPNYHIQPQLGYDDQEFEWSHLLQTAWRKNPTVVLSAIGLVLLLLLYSAYSFGQQKQLAQQQSSRGEVHSGEGSRTSRLTQSAPGAVDDDISSGAAKEIGKMNFDLGNILGTGCAGTTVYRGHFDGRPVAIKRVLTSQFKLVERELELLRKSDAHKNVIRYFCSERDDNFHYIALELCECTLSDYVRVKDYKERYKSSIRDILKQATEGVSHLHSISIVHRDLKPQNILLTKANNDGHVNVKISDFGLCKQVKLGHASISKVSGLVGTEGWIAPEAINLDSSSVTYSVDVFSLGCIFYYVISNGKHPFGDSNAIRHNNIYNGKYNLEYLVDKEDYVAMNAIEKMIEMDPNERPSAATVLCHPIFWANERQLQFFMDVSDRIEKEDENSEVVRSLEHDNYKVVSNNWHVKLPITVQDELRGYRTYKGHSVKDLLRAIRNKKHHYRELRPEAMREFGSIPDGYTEYFNTRFPHLLIHAFKVMSICADESIFTTYYPLESRSFCGRVLQKQLQDGFVSTYNGSPRRSFLDKQPQSVQMSPKFWRPSPPPVAPPPGFPPKPANDTFKPPINAAGDKPVKKRGRGKKKASFAALASTLETSEPGVNHVEVKEEKYE